MFKPLLPLNAVGIVVDNRIKNNSLKQHKKNRWFYRCNNRTYEKIKDSDAFAEEVYHKVLNPTTKVEKGKE